MKLRPIQTIVKGLILFAVAGVDLLALKFFLEQALLEVNCSVESFTAGSPFWLKESLGLIGRLISPDHLTLVCQAISVAPSIIGMGAACTISAILATWILSRDIPDWFWRWKNRRQAQKALKQIRQLKRLIRAIDLNALDQRDERRLLKTIKALEGQ